MGSHQPVISSEIIQPFLRFSQMAIQAVLLYLVVEGIPGFTLAWPSYAVITWIGLGCILVAGVFYAAHNHAWLWRVVVSALLVASLVPLWQYASLPRLFELQLHSITHITERVSDKQAGKWTNWWRLQHSSRVECATSPLADQKEGSRNREQNQLPAALDKPPGCRQE
jgi:hypothetical protein